jgi:hypothetical protein
MFAKSPCRKLFPKKRQKCRCQFFLDFFCFIAFSGVSQRWEFKNTTKNRFAKNRVEKFLQKIDKKSKTNFFSNFFYHVFWAFLGEGSSKTRLKNREKKLTSPGTGLASEEPTNHVKVRRFVF